MLQSWDEQAENHAAILRYLNRGEDPNRIYRTARRRGVLLLISVLANGGLLYLLLTCLSQHR
jgi:hypothetical protein